jgi:hypothetical protein
MAQLAAVGSRSDDQTVVADAVRDLRLHADREFAAAQQSADEAAFELAGVGSEGSGAARLAARDRLQRAAAEAQSVFLTQLALANQRPNFPAVELPAALVGEVRRFDAVVADGLAIVADHTDGAAPGPLPDMRTSLATLAAAVRTELERAVSPEVAAQVEGRLELYRNLVPRIERLGAAELGA